MLKKILIVVLLSASFKAWATPCGVMFPQLQIKDSVFMCRVPPNGTMDTLRFETQPSVMYEWEGGSQNPYYIPSYIPINVSHKVWVKLTDSIDNDNWCSDTIIIEAFPLPHVVEKLDIIDTTLCFGEIFTLKAGEALNAEHFEWQVFRDGILTPAETSQDSTFEIIFDSDKLSEKILRYEIVYSGFCTKWWEDFEIYEIHDTITTVFFAKPPIVNLGPDTIFCDDGNGFKLEALNEIDFLIDKYKFRWNDQDKNNQNTFIVLYDEKGTQFVEVWNEFCRKKSPEDSILYTAFDTVDVDFWPHQWTNAYLLIEDTSVCKREIRLNATAEWLTGETTYHWETSSDFNIRPNDTTDPKRTIPSGTYGNFTVILRDSAGCERPFSISIIDNCLTEEKPTVVMPNVFTPNGDGFNDVFEPKSFSDNLKNFRIRIYNRWGREVHKFDGDIEKWNGWDGHNTPEGVYFWVIRFDDLFDRNYQTKGTVTLLR
jgi:gliding motility-associated-like protein